MSGCFCWLVALGLLAVVGYGVYFLATQGGSMALRREALDRLRIVNDARARSRKRPLTLEELENGIVPEEERLVAMGVGESRPPASPLVTAASVPADIPMAQVAPMAESPWKIVLIEDVFTEINQEWLRRGVELAWGVAVTEGAGSGPEWVSYRRSPEPGMISCGGYRFEVKNLPGNYFDDYGLEPGVSGGESGSIRERALGYRVLGMLGSTGDLSRDQGYALLGKLASAVSGRSTVGVYLPEFQLTLPAADWVWAALSGQDVLGSIMAGLKG